ncbi:F0F1 ATP synthase subunit B family protein [Sphingomonas aestuarii]
MPQIAQVAETFASQIFWLLVTFGLVYFVIGRGIASRVQGTADKRDKMVSDDLAAAEAARAAADATEEKWRAEENAAREEAQKLIGAARQKASANSEVTVARANEATAARIAEAEARIAGASQAAMAEIETVAADAARDIVARLSGAEVTDADARSAVKAAMAHG